MSYEPVEEVEKDLRYDDLPFPYDVTKDPVYTLYYERKYSFVPEAERIKQYKRTSYFREMNIATSRDYRMYRDAAVRGGVALPPNLLDHVDQFQETDLYKNSKQAQRFPDHKPLGPAERRRYTGSGFASWADSDNDGYNRDGLSPRQQLEAYDSSLPKKPDPPQPAPTPQPPAPDSGQMLPPVRPSYAMDQATGQPKDQFTYDGNLFRAWYNQKISKGEKVDYASLLKKWKDQSSTGDKEFEEDWLGDQKEYLLYEKEKKVPPQGFQSKDEAYDAFVGRKNRENPNYDAAAKAFGPGWDDLSPLQQQEQISAYKPPAPAPKPPAPKPDPKPPAPKPDPKPPAPKPDPKPPAPKPDPKPPAPKPDPKPPAPKPDPKPPAPKPDPKPPAPKPDPKPPAPKPDPKPPAPKPKPDPKPPAPKPKKPVDPPAPAPSPGPTRVSGHSPLRIVRFL